jgi:cell division protein FtsL
MTYSNINKDNIQAKMLSKIKKITIVFLLIITIIYSGTNIINQYQILIEANRSNQEKELNITNLKGEISNMRQKVEYASSSAFIARRMRQFYGLGLPGDNWIIFNKNKQESNIGQIYNVTVNKPNIIQWWEAFTK